MLLMRERSLKLDAYLNRQVFSHSITPESLEVYKNAIGEVLQVFTHLGIPDACPGPDGQMIYYWSRSKDSVQVEVRSDGESEFYYRNPSSHSEFIIEYRVGQFAKKVSEEPQANATLLTG